MNIKSLSGFSEREIGIIRDALELSQDWPNGFEFPDYGGLPEKIRRRLWSDQVDYLQGLQYDKEFSLIAVTKALINGSVLESN
jgi:hypothetical protein